MEKEAAGKKNGLTLWIVLAVVIIIVIGFFMWNKGKVAAPAADESGAAGGDAEVTGGEDAWAKDSRGVYVKQGNPAETPAYVDEQESVIVCADMLYYEYGMAKMQFSSQCLGQCLNKYAVDIVHVPRTADDDKAESQCAGYLSGRYKNIIELDADGKIVKIA